MYPKIAVVGCGYWGKNLVRNFKELNALSLICENSPQGIETAKAIASGYEIVRNYQDVLNSDVEAVVIATPAETHFDLADQALQAGKDVFVEKPLAINYHQGEKLVETAYDHDKILMVGHVLEYHPGIFKLIELIRSGELGKVRYIYSNRLSLGKIRREENILWSFAPHDIAVILRIVGAMPFEVVACGGGYVQPNIADVTVTQLLFNNGVRAHIYVSWLHPFKEQRLVVIGSEKMVSFDDVSKKLILYDQRVEIEKGEPIPIKKEGQAVYYDSFEPLKRECEAFIDALKTRKPPLADGKSGLNVLRVLQASQRSLILNGERVAIPENGYVEKRVRVIHETVPGNEPAHTDHNNGNGKEIKIVHE